PSHHYSRHLLLLLHDALPISLLSTGRTMGKLTLVFEHHPNRRLADFGRISVWSAHDSKFSKNGVSGKTWGGSVHRLIQKQWSSAQGHRKNDRRQPRLFELNLQV